MEIVCDPSELTAFFGNEAPAKVPDVFVVAGYSVRSEQLLRLTRDAEKIKKEILGHANAPIKWNVDDLKRALKQHELSELLPTIKANRNPIRAALLKSLCDSEATVFLSAILAYSNRRQVLGESKNDLVRYSFGNFLMRVGLFCKEKRTTEVQLIVDWPDKSDRSLFVHEFYSGWKSGRSGTGTDSVNYHCGALSSLGFQAGLLFGVTDVDVRLQLADLVVGTCRSFINYCMGRCAQNDFGVQQFKAIAPHLDRDSQRRVFGRGIAVSPTNSDFSKKIADGFRVLGC